MDLDSLIAASAAIFLYRQRQSGDEKALFRKYNPVRRSVPFFKLTAHKFLTANQKINFFYRYQGYVTWHLKRPGSPGDEDGDVRDCVTLKKPTAKVSG